MTDPPAPPPAAPPAPPAGASPIWTLIVGLGVIAVVALASDIASLFAADVYDDAGRMSWLRFELIDSGLGFAMRIMVVVGALELLRRTSGGAHKGAQLALAGASLGLAVLLFRQGVRLTVDDHMMQASLHKIASYVFIAGEYAFAAGLVIAGWRAPVVRNLAVPYLIATVVAFPPRFLGEAIYGMFQAGGYKHVLLAYGVMSCLARVLAAVVVWKGTPSTPMPAAFDRASSGFDRAASALFARLWIALGAIMLFLMMIGTKSEGVTVAKLFVAGVPAANAIAGVILGAGLLAAAAMAVPAAVRIQIVVAAAALLWTVGVQLSQAIAAYRSLAGDRPDGDMLQGLAQTLSLALPIVNALAMALVAHSVSGIGRALGNAALERSGLSATYASLLCNLAAVGLTYAVASQTSVGGALLFMGLALVLVIIALISVARVCREAASVLRARGTADLPVAIVHDGGGGT